MKSLLHARTALCLAVGGALLFQQPLTPASATERTRQEQVHHDRGHRASLRIAPRLYVGGQRVTFAGNLGRKGKRAVHLQTHMGRPGDKWTNVAGSGARTNAKGSFRFSHIAPSMFGIKIRVVSKGVATPARTLDPKSQEIGLQVARSSGGFTINVDTTPTVPRRPDLPTPAFPGRTLTLEKRADDGHWESTGRTTTTDSKGHGSFQVSASSAEGVFRVVEENYRARGNKIGWFPSFPVDLEASAPRESAALTARPTGASDTALSAKPHRPPTTAANTYGWGRSLWDFAWEWGESLTSGPYRGTDKHGWWLDTSNGSGRVAKHNGGLTLESQYNFDGRGDHGSTWATLRGNPATYGRWETKLRMNSSEKNAKDYRVRVELVPDGAPDDRCRTITVADLAAHGSNVTVAANGADRRWSYSKRIGSLLNGSTASFAAEVTRGHISWFVNGRIIATARNQAAVSDTPLTMRLSMVGTGQDEMNRTAAIFDWQRGYSLAHGRSPANGHALSAASSPC